MAVELSVMAASAVARNCAPEAASAALADWGRQQGTLGGAASLGPVVGEVAVMRVALVCMDTAVTWGNQSGRASSSPATPGSRASTQSLGAAWPSLWWVNLVCWPGCARCAQDIKREMSGNVWLGMATVGKSRTLLQKQARRSCKGLATTFGRLLCFALLCIMSCEHSPCTI